jgi:hypothetical protein
MMPRTNGLHIGLGLFALLFTQMCCSQVSSPPPINTASAGVRAADVEAAVAAICPTRDITRSKNGGVSGCRVCPEGTDFAGEAQSNWGLYAETPGHFTSDQDDNLLLDGTGCDSHANNFGGSFMFSLKSGKARLLKYDKGLVSSQCHKFAYADARDFLVCRVGWTGMGEIDQTVFMAAFDASGKDMTTNLISVRNTTFACGEGSTEGVQNPDIKGIEFSNRQTGAIIGATVTATLEIVKCSQGKNGERAANQSVATRTYEISFLFDGKRFKVAPASRAAFDRINVN